MDKDSHYREGPEKLKTLLYPHREFLLTLVVVMELPSGRVSGTQARPPPWGAGLVQDLYLVSTPPPQVTRFCRASGSTQYDLTVDLREQGHHPARIMTCETLLTMGTTGHPP